MRLIATMCCRSEDWILGVSLRAALQWNDAVVLLLHSCKDRSAAIARDVMTENHGRILLLIEDADDWHEMAHRQKMLELARADGATHISIVDCDEILTANCIERIRGDVERTPRGQVLQYPLYNLRGGLDRYHVNGTWGQRWVSVAFADDPQLGWRGNTFHSREPQRAGVAVAPMRGYQPMAQSQGGVLHLWGASERRLIARHRMYRIAEALQWPQKPRHLIEEMYSMATDGRPKFGEVPERWTYTAVPPEWWAGYDQSLINLDQIPWQEAYCDEMIEAHGIHRFDGLRVQSSDFPDLLR